MAFLKIVEGIRILQLNVEGISKDKSEVLARLAYDNKADVILLQEVHVKSEQDLINRGTIPGYTLAASIPSQVYGIATYVSEELLEYDITYCDNTNDIHVINLLIGGINVMNVYKPPSIPWASTVLPFPGDPCFLGGDLNSHHELWGYSKNDFNGDVLYDWICKNEFQILHSAKDKSTFQSARWNTGTNPDLSLISSSISKSVNKTVLSLFPRSQHRPILTDIGLSIPLIESCPKNRWNFDKADWINFETELDHVVKYVPVKISNYDRFVGLVKAIAKKHIPRGYRKKYVPGWNSKCDEIFDKFLETENVEFGHELLYELNLSRNAKWIRNIEQVDFKHSSRKAWSLLKKLGCANQSKAPSSIISANDVASRLILNSKQFVAKDRVKAIKKKLCRKRRSISTDKKYSGSFSMEELEAAISDLKTRKAPGFDNMFAEFIKHFGIETKKWMLEFFNLILMTGKMPKVFKRAKIITVLKPGKDGTDVSHHRPVSLLSIAYKLLERMILNRLQPFIDDFIPKEQAAFRPQRSCDEQVLALTTYIERGFQEGLKTFVAMIDLSCAYDTVWREGLLLKLSNIIPDRKIIDLVDSCLSNRLLRVFMSSSTSRWRRLNNGLPQGSVLSPVLYNIYTSDLPYTRAKKFVFADDKALAVQSQSFEAAEVILEEDLVIMDRYYTDWRLKPNPGKTAVAAFHLNNKEAKKELIVKFKGVQLFHNPAPKYLGVQLDRSLTFKNHIEKLCLKLNSRNNIIQKLVGSGWGASADTLRTSSLSLVYSTAEYGCAVWRNSSHAYKVDTKLNQTMRIISGTVKSTPVVWLPTLCNIAPPDLRRCKATSNLIQRCMRHDSSLLKDELFLRPVHRLNSRYFIWNEVPELLKFDITDKWRERWTDSSPCNYHLCMDPTLKPGGFLLSRIAWCRLNRIRTGHGRCNSCLFKWNMTDSPACDCGCAEQTMGHIISSCPLRRFFGSLEELSDAETDRAVDYLMCLDLNL